MDAFGYDDINVAGSGGSRLHRFTLNRGGDLCV